MLNSLGLATEGLLRGGDSPTLSLATTGFIFIEFTTILPSFIPSSVSFGIPTLTKVGLLINPATIPSEVIVGSPLVTGGGHIVIPALSRRSFNTVAQYLRDLVFKGQDNEVIIAWLKSEGIDTGVYNELWYEYLYQNDFVQGSLTDRYAAWRADG